MSEQRLGVLRQESWITRGAHRVGVDHEDGGMIRLGVNDKFLGPLLDSGDQEDLDDLIHLVTAAPFRIAYIAAELKNHATIEYIALLRDSDRGAEDAGTGLFHGLMAVGEREEVLAGPYFTKMCIDDECEGFEAHIRGFRSLFAPGELRDLDPDTASMVSMEGIERIIGEELLAASNIDDAEIRRRARAQYHDEGTIEVDDNAMVSRSWESGGDRGAYVQAWVWVDLSDVLEDGPGGDSAKLN